MWEFLEVNTHVHVFKLRLEFSNIHSLKIRALAIKELSKTEMNPMEKILLAKECKVSSWLLSGYNELVRQPQALAFQDLEGLGWETAAKLLQVREQDLLHHIASRPPATHMHCPACRSYVQLQPQVNVLIRQTDYIAKLRSVFEAELANMDNLE
jgi:hypothetical protein